VESAGVAVKAGHQSRQIQRHVCCRFVSGCHLPGFTLCVPVDGGFEKVAILGKKIRTAALAGADEVKQFALAFKRFAGVAIKTEPGPAPLFVDAVVDARSSVGKFARKESF